MRRVFVTNGAEFRVIVTNADGKTTTQSLSELGMTLCPDVTRITLPDGLQSGGNLDCAAEQLALKCAA